MRKKILIVVDCYDRARFFNRFIDADVEVFAITPRKKYIENHQFIVKKCNKFSFVFNLIFKSFQWLDRVKSTIDYHKYGIIRSIVSYTYGYTLCKQISNTNNIHKCFIWNGAQAFSSGVSDAINDAKIEKTFLELANVPGKIFSNHMGVNKQSSLFHDIKPVEKLNLDEEQVNKWLTGYLNNLKSQSVPQQYDLVVNDSNNHRGINKIFAAVKKHLFGNDGQFKMVSDIDWYGLHDSSYVFVPLQVSTDTQLILNSKINNEDLVNILLKEKKYRQKKFILKFHPCDSQTSVTKILKLIAGDSRFKINQGSTYTLINNSSEVLTINSTVGMEAKLLNKNVTFFGDSFFENMKRETILKYISGYLLSIDYFKNDSFCKEELNELL